MYRFGDCTSPSTDLSCATPAKHIDIVVPDQSGTLALVTGANSGIGFGVSQRLVAAGAEVILAVRNMDKGNKAAQDIRVEHPAASVVVEQLDLASLASIAAFADRMLTSGRPIHLLINNAGLMALPTLYAATNPLAAGAEYYGPGGFGELTGLPKAARIPRKALDENTARRLWQVSEELTGVHFPVD